MRKRSRAVTQSEYFVVDDVVDRRIGPTGELEYYVRWKGFSDDECTWEPRANLIPDCRDVVDALDDKLLANDANRPTSVPLTIGNMTRNRRVVHELSAVPLAAMARAAKSMTCLSPEQDSLLDNNSQGDSPASCSSSSKPDNKRESRTVKNTEKKHAAEDSPLRVVGVGQISAHSEELYVSVVSSDPRREVTTVDVPLEEFRLAFPQQLLDYLLGHTLLLSVVDPNKMVS